ncbi:putative Fe-S oxidoreductase [plant metagenome]|uniref:Putative Fe-S oxidoreductase n=1 Tax=plant metagenome TaxID=1297885 RepID=A0A484RGE8_9ZZZZ
MARTLSGSALFRALGAAATGTAFMALALPALAQGANQPAFRYAPAADMARATPAPVIDVNPAPGTPLTPAPPAAPAAVNHPMPRVLPGGAQVQVSSPGGPTPGQVYSTSQPAAPDPVTPITPAAKPATQSAKPAARPDKVYSTSPKPASPKVARPAGETRAKPDIPDKVYGTRSLSTQQPATTRRERQVTPVQIQVEPVVPIRAPRDRYLDVRPRDPVPGR